MPFEPIEDQQSQKEEQEKEESEEKQSFFSRWFSFGGEEPSEEELITIEEEETYRKGTVAIRDLIAPAAMKIEPTYIRLGETYIRSMYVITYPRYISVGWNSPILNMSSTLDVSMFFYPVDSAVILKQLKKKVGALQAEMAADREKGAPRDPVKETALQDIEQLRNDLTQGTEQFFSFAFYVTLYAESKDELDSISEDLETIFGSKLIYSKSVLYQAEQGFTSTLPLGLDELLVHFNMNSSPIASSFPFVSSELTSDEGILYGVNRHNNSLILFDRFSLANANMTVFATSGAGKSYAVKLEILRTLMMGGEIIVIDPEREYQNLCQAVGGTYVNLSLSSESNVNPFDLPEPTGEETSTEDIIRSAVITLKGLLKIMFGGLTTEEDALLDQALLETYAKKDITPGTDLSTAEPPLMQDLKEVLEGMEGAEDLVTKLQKYTDGTFSGLFNSPTNVNMDNRLVVFSVRDLEDELRPMAIYNLVNYIWNRVRSELKKRLLIIDEGWWMMMHEESAKFIFSLVKRARKYYLGVTMISQDVNDFLNSQYGKAIVTNSSLNLLMKQDPSAIDNVQETFMLTEGEKYLLLESDVGEGIFFAGRKHAAIKVVASYTEDQLVTTNPEQLMEIEEEKEEYKEQVAQQGNQPQGGEERGSEPATDLPA
ncbi:MAG: VirB4-like conjugal transfer ATPase, CD1110 family [Candidatus Magasanikbacteria bacterium]